MIASAITIVIVTAAVGTLAMGFRFIAERRIRATAEMVCQSHMELLLAVTSSRTLTPDDCDPVRYTRQVIGDESRTAAFVASCRLDDDRPSTPTRRYARLTTTVTSSIDGRGISTSFVTYVESR